MKKIFKRVLILIIAGALVIALPIEITGLVRNQETLKTEVEDKVEYAARSAGVEFNIVFNSMESLVNMMQALVEVTFTGDEYINDYAAFAALKQQTGKILKRSLESTDHLSGLYVTFNPKLHTGMEEVWYAYKEGRVKKIDARLSAPSWLVEGNPRVDYYYDAIRYGSYWGGLDYESALDEYMTTHTKSVYDSAGNLIGIVGSDMLMSEVINMLESVKMYDDSEVALFDSDMTFYASSDSHAAVSFAPVKSRIAASSDDSGHIWYKASDGSKYIAAYTKLNNGWILVSAQPEKTVMTSASTTRKTLLATMLLTIIVIVSLTAVLIRKFYGPVVESAQQNEIILINQSRQAKLGEMIGNIAHQCKQPLNSINIDIANMKDDYYASELSPEIFNRYTAKIKDNISIMSDTITDFADFLKPDRKKETFFINDVISKVLSMMAESLKINKIRIDFNCTEKIAVTSYRNELTQCIFNILENARDAVVSSNISDRLISIDLSRLHTDAGDTIYINIFNTGHSIPDDAGSNIFAPYFSTKEAAGGTGLGLYLTRQIIEEHFAGKVYYTNSTDGVTFTIEFKEY